VCESQTVKILYTSALVIMLTLKFIKD